MSDGTHVFNGRTAAGVRVYADPAWPLPDSVRIGCTKRSDRQDPMCRTGRRWVTGLSYSSGLRWMPFLAYYVFPHGEIHEADNPLASTLNDVHLPGYRVDLRQERMRPYTTRDSITVFHAERRAATLRISPNTIRFTSWFGLMPQAIGNFGLSYFGGRELRLAGGWGIGLKGMLWGQDWLLEVQRTSRTGHYASEWTSSFALLWPFTPR